MRKTTENTSDSVNEVISRSKQNICEQRGSVKAEITRLDRIKIGNAIKNRLIDSENKNISIVSASNGSDPNNIGFP